jgi:hypothetical protein
MGLKKIFGQYFLTARVEIKSFIEADNVSAYLKNTFMFQARCFYGKLYIAFWIKMGYSGEE